MLCVFYDVKVNLGNVQGHDVANNGAVGYVFNQMEQDVLKKIFMGAMVILQWIYHMHKTCSMA